MQDLIMLTHTKLKIIDEPIEAVDKLEVITENEEDIGALEIGITSVLLESLTEAVVAEQSRNVGTACMLMHYV